MRIGMVAAIAAMLLAGCAMDGRRGATGPVKYRNMSCARLDRERAKTEVATNRLFLSLRRKQVFGQRAEAEILALWPTLMFLRGQDSPDAQRYALLKSDYEALRTVSRERGCKLGFASDVSKTVVGADRSPDAERINAVVGEETAR